MGAKEGWEVCATEYCSRAVTATWYQPQDATKPPKLVRNGTQRRMVALRAWRGLVLPEGFPDSVSPDYLPFQFWDSVQALSSYCRGVLTTHALMRGLGVGEESATAASAALQWVVKDLVGMVGGICFSLAQGTGFDANAKQWRFFADCANNAGLLLELVAPLFPGLFLWFLCAGSVARALTGVAAGATRASLTQHFAASGNAADIAAKEGSQETCVTLVGLLLGMVLVRTLAAWPSAVWPIFALLTALHVYANASAMRCLQLNSLNRHRTTHLLEHFLTTKRAPTPAEVAPHEPLLPGQAALQQVCARLWHRRGARPAVTVSLGARLLDVVRPHAGGEELVRALAATDGAAWWCWPTAKSGADAAGEVPGGGVWMGLPGVQGDSPHAVVHWPGEPAAVLLRPRLAPPKLLQAFTHAQVYVRLLQQGKARVAAAKEATTWIGAPDGYAAFEVRDVRLRKAHRANEGGPGLRLRCVRRERTSASASRPGCSRARRWGKGGAAARAGRASSRGVEPAAGGAVPGGVVR